MATSQLIPAKASPSNIKNAARTAYFPDKPRKKGFEAHHSGEPFSQLWPKFQAQHPEWFGPKAPALELAIDASRNGPTWYVFKNATIGEEFRKFHAKNVEWKLLNHEEHLAVHQAEEQALAKKGAAATKTAFKNTVNKQAAEIVSTPKEHVPYVPPQFRKQPAQYVTQYDPTNNLQKTISEISEDYIEYMSEVTNKFIAYDLIDRQAAAWVAEYGAKEITAVNNSTRAGINRITQLGLQEGYTVKQQAKLIKEQVGLLPTHVTAVNNYRKQLTELGMAENVIDKKAAKYASQLLNYRAETIAITETEAASAMGHALVNTELVKTGVIAPNEYLQQWVTSPDERQCKICGGLDGRTSPIGEGFGNIPYGSKAHVRCRCRVVLIKNKDYKPLNIPTEAPTTTTTTPIDFESSIKGATPDQMAALFKEKYPNAKVDLSLADPILQRDLYMSLNKVLKDTPYPEDVLTSLRLSAPGEGMFEYVPNAYAGASGTSIELNAGYYADKAVLDSSIARDVAAGFHPKGFSPEWIVTHEMGHNVMEVIKQMDPNKRQSILDTIQKATRSGELGDWGEYASSRPDEGFAEIFSSIYHTNESDKPWFVKQVQDSLIQPIIPGDAEHTVAGGYIKPIVYDPYTDPKLAGKYIESYNQVGNGKTFMTLNTMDTNLAKEVAVIANGINKRSKFLKEGDTLVNSFYLPPTQAEYDKNSGGLSDAYAYNFSLGTWNQIVFNPKAFTDKVKLDAAFSADVAAGFHPKGATSNFIIVHEMGHSAAKYLEANYPEDTARISKIMDAAHANGELKKFAEYANTSNGEAFAEVYAAIYTIPSDKLPKFVNDIALILNGG